MTPRWEEDLRDQDRQFLKDEVWLSVAFDIARLGTCARRKVGAVFLDERGHVLSTGYNGPAPDEPHCTDHPCPGADCPSGTGLELCEAIHAEQNALAQCKFPERVHTIYCTDSPCSHCIKMLATTSAKRIVFARAYPHSASEAYWKRRGGVWDHRPLSVPQPTTSIAPTTSWGVFRGWLARWSRWLGRNA